MTLYTALGDSITFGENATKPQLAYPSQFVRLLNSQSEFRRSGSRVQGEILAYPGWTSSALRNAIATNSPNVLAKSKLITIWIGGDDLGDAALAVSRGAPSVTIQRSIQAYGIQLLSLVRNIQSVSHAKVFLFTQYNPFPNTPLANTAVQSLNRVTERVAEQTRCLIAPTHIWFEGRQPSLISGYQTGRIGDVMRNKSMPIHPNNRGHEVIAKGLYQMVAPIM